MKSFFEEYFVFYVNMYIVVFFFFLFRCRGDCGDSLGFFFLF